MARILHLFLQICHCYHSWLFVWLSVACLSAYLIVCLFCLFMQWSGGCSQNLSSVTNDSFCYKLLKSLLLIGYQQICHWFLSFVIENRLCETGLMNVHLFIAEGICRVVHDDLSPGHDPRQTEQSFLVWQIRQQIQAFLNLIKKGNQTLLW